MSPKTLLSFFTALVLAAGMTACGAEDDHGHPHDGGSDHAHDGGQAQGHDEESAPETTAIYEEEAPAEAPAAKKAPADDHDYAHDDDGGHSH